MIENQNKIERALAVAVFPKGGDREKSFEYLDELIFLAETAGVEIVDKIYQELEKPKKSTLVGKGKLEEIHEFILENKLDLVIFDNDLSPTQVRNIEKKLEIKVLDRSALILDIFASRAKTSEAKAQVELAQLKYTLTRLTNMWTHLSKQFAGVGMKGPGETQIETDRRLIKKKIEYLKNKLENIDKQNYEKRKNRHNMPRFALVGYTNAGKSTLMELITKSDTYIEDKLFATLDTTVRKFHLINGKQALLSDTVGFIRKLPSHLIASFRTTLSEAREADFLIHVVDVSHKYFRDHITTVNETLNTLGISDKNIIIVFNKIDQMEEQEEIVSIKEEFHNCIFISAKRGININAFHQLLQDKYDEYSKNLELFIPYSQSSIVAKLFTIADILEQESDDFGTKYKLKVQNDNQEYFNNTYSDFII